MRGSGKGGGSCFAHVAFVWVDLETSEAFRAGRFYSIIPPRIGGLNFEGGVWVQGKKKGLPRTLFLHHLSFPFVCCGYPRSIELEAPER